MTRGRRGLALAASLSISCVLGSIHAFSIFLRPLESAFGASRSAVSLTYSLALIALTLGVLLGHRLYRALPAGWTVLLIGALAAAGTAVGAAADSLAVLWLGYSLVFGFANGLGYGYSLHVAGQAFPGREGTFMGIATATYALGAALTPPLLSPSLQEGAVSGALLLLSAALVCVSLAAALLLKLSGFAFLGETSRAAGTPPIPRATVAILWLSYGAAVAAGLMAIGHATGIAEAAALSAAMVAAAPVVVALANMLGGILGGLFLDRSTVTFVLSTLSALSAAALLVIVVFQWGGAAIVGLAFVGLSYGAIIAVYPAAIVRLFGPVLAVRTYGTVFTAWGLAGFVAPWLAGWLFDLQGGYRLALSLAAALALLSGCCVFAYRKRLS